MTEEQDPLPRFDAKRVLKRHRAINVDVAWSEHAPKRSADQIETLTSDVVIEAVKMHSEVIPALVGDKWKLIIAYDKKDVEFEKTMPSFWKAIAILRTIIVTGEKDGVDTVMLARINTHGETPIMMCTFIKKVGHVIQSLGGKKPKANTEPKITIMHKRLETIIEETIANIYNKEGTLLYYDEEDERITKRAREPINEV